MLKHIKNVFKNAVLYSVGTISTKLIGFVLLPLYTKHLSTQEYGILALLEISTLVLVATFGLKLDSALFRWYWDKDYANRKKSMYFSIMTALLFIASFMVLSFSTFSGRLSLLLFDQSGYSFLLRIMLVSAGMQIIARIVLTLMRLQEKPILYSTSNIAQLVVTLLFTIYFIVSLNKSVEGIYEAQIIGYAVFFIFTATYIWKNIKFKFEIRILREMLAFSFPLVFAEISGVLLSIVDRYCLNFLGGLSDVGIYSLGYKMANTIRVFVYTSVQLAVSPMIFKMMDQPGNKRFYSKIMTYMAFGVIFFVLGLSFYGREIIELLAQRKDYWDAYKVIPILSFALFFGILKDTALTGINIVKKTKILASIVVLMLVFNIILNFLLIPHLQYLGSAWAALATQVSFFLFVYRYSQKYYPIPYEFGKVIKVIIVSVTLLLVSFAFSDLNLVIRIILKMLLILALPILLYFWNFFENIELLRMKQAWNKWKNPANWCRNISNITLK